MSEAAKFAKIIIDISAAAVDRAFTYRIPEQLQGMLVPGMRVQVPFGSGQKLKAGYVIALEDTADFDPARLKEIAGLLPRALTADEEMIKLALFLSEEYACTLNQALKTVLPVRERVRKNKRRSDPVARIEALGGDETALTGDPELNEEQAYVYQKLRAEMEFLFCAKPQPVQSTDPALFVPQNGAKPASQDESSPADLEKGNRPALLHGITGSGKTLLYIRLIEYALAKGREAIVLIPEISLTYQTVRALSSHFGSSVAVLHSRLSAGERYEQYQKAAGGEIRVMVGPRSAVFAPFANLGLVVIDEEHERSYQSDTTPRYDVRTVAAKRAALAGAKLLLCSATPSLMSYTMARTGAYELFCLTRRAARGAKLPAVHLIDLRRELAAGNRSIFSEKLQELMDERLQKREQIMLFINRRGYAGFVSCRSCGFVVKCPHCDVSMTAHNDWYFDRRTGKKEAARLSCHYCGHEEPMPRACPSCGSPYIAPFGTGTQKLELAVRRRFPAARILRMDADSTSRKGAHEEILSAFQNGKADILIGTQMIVKGHDFPNVTLVGIVAADLSLNTPEYDAAERTFQLITQAAGRAGRGQSAGDVVIQTYDPSHYAIETAAAQDYRLFYAREMSYRRLMDYPPFTELLCIRLQSGDEALLGEAAKALFDALSLYAEPLCAKLIGPCKASLYKLNDNYRKILYIKHPDHAIIKKIREEARRFLEHSRLGREVYLNFDLKPGVPGSRSLSELL